MAPVISLANRVRNCLEKYFQGEAFTAAEVADEMNATKEERANGISVALTGLAVRKEIEVVHTAPRMDRRGGRPVNVFRIIQINPYVRGRDIRDDIVREEEVKRQRENAIFTQNVMLHLGLPRRKQCKSKTK